ncbi:MAG: flagellar capping protein FliD [Crocinitomicaceae bacterium]|jgi:flagellar capping protein FliD
MKIRIFTLLLIAASNLNAQDFEWAKSMGSTVGDRGNSISVDASGNVYTTGYFWLTVDFDPGPGVSSLTSNGASDVFITKFDPSGNFIWAKSFGGLNYDHGFSAEIDNSGNILLCGRFEGVVDFDPGIGVSNLTSNGLRDIFILKLDNSGDFVWVKSFGGLNNDNALSLCIDGLDNIYTTGDFQGTADFDPGIGVLNLVSNGASDVFITKLDASGNFVWAKSFGDTNGDNGNSVQVNQLEEVFICGNYQGTVDFDPGVGINNLTSNGARDAFVLKLDDSGNFSWVISSGGISNDAGNDVQLDDTGNVYFTGSFYSTVDFDPGIGVQNITSFGGADIFVCKVDEFGNFLWAKNIGGSDNDLASQMTIDNLGNVYTTGNFQGTADFDPNGTDFNLSTNGDRDIYISKLDLMGDFVWAQYLGSSTADYGVSISSDDFANIYVTGRFQSTVDFEFGAGISNLTSNGSHDVFVLKLSQCIDNASTDVQTACDSYLWIDGVTYTSSNNVATQTYTNAAGCDSIVTLDLTVNYSNASTDVQTACDSYLWIDGVMYTSSNNVATQTYTNAAGCDSIVTLDLTVNYSNASTDVQTSCDSYLWIDGVTYTSSNNVATQTFTNAAGCDSIVTLDLTVNYSNGSTDVQTACDSYLWIDGVTYTSSNNVATQTYTNASGCDSIVTLDLTVNYSNASTDVQTSCDSYLWIDGVTYNSSNNSATQTYTNATGCDSIVTLDLTVNYSNGSTDVQTACDSYLWIDGVTYTSSNTIATQTYTNAAGCDSIVTLNLTVNYSSASTDVQTACDSYLWIDGVTYTSSNNVATHTLTNTAGCDSIVTLDLTVNYSNGSTDVQTACDSYLWIDGVTYTSSNNVATQTLTNAAGCDSIVTLDLTINYSNASTDVQTACDSYLWIDGVTYTSSNNAATQTFTNAAGCDSIVTLDLTINTVNTSTTTTGLTITSDAASAAYQWIDCSDNSEIIGETNQSFTATSNGDYAVIVTENGCSDTSACVVIDNVGITENDIFKNVLVYPNPINGIIHLDLGSLTDVQVSIFTIRGREVLAPEKIKTSIHQFSFNEPAGIYYLRLESEGISKSYKLIKQ